MSTLARSIGWPIRLRRKPALAWDFSRVFGVPNFSQPILLSQCLRLLGAAKRVKRVGSDAGARLGPSVVPASRCLMGRKRELRDSQRLGGASGFQQQACVISCKLLCKGMVAAEHLLADDNRFCEPWLGFTDMASSR